MTKDYERATKMSAKIKFTNWVWEPSVTKICEESARIALAQIIEDEAFIEWKNDKIRITMGPFVFKFNKKKLHADSEDGLCGFAEIKLSGEWSGE